MGNGDHYNVAEVKIVLPSENIDPYTGKIRISIA